MAEDFSHLRALILNSSALQEAERQYWLDLLPTMSKEQLSQLKSILETEQKNFQDLDKKYDQKLEEAGSTFLSRWNSERATAARLKREEEEKSSAEESGKKAEELLKLF